MFKEAPCTTAKTWKQAKWIRTDEWVNKMGYPHTARYYSAIKGWHHAMSSNKEEEETIILSDGRQRKTSITWCHLVLNSNNGYKWTSLPNRNPHGIAKHLIVTEREMWWASRNEQVETNIHTLLFPKKKKISEGLYSTLHNKLYGKRTQKGYVHIYA